MKKKIIIVLSVMYLLFLFGGFYLVRSMDTNASRFNDIIKFHRVEILRESLLLSIRRVEADLYSQGTPHAESADAVESHVDEMGFEIDSCFNCHHTESVLERLQDLQHQIDQYSHAVSKALILKSDVKRLQTEQEKAHLIGDSLIGKVNTMIAMTNKRLAERTEEALHEVRRTRILLIMVIAAGPVLIAILAFMAIRGITGPIQSLLDATRNLKAGNLGYRIEGLRDEFGELAVGFNAMASSLTEQVKKIEESEKR